MRSIRASLITIGLAAAFAALGPAKADTIIGLVNPNSGNCYPFLCNDSSQSSGPSIEYQQVYSSSAFSGVMNIGSVTFYEATQFGGTGTVLGGTYAFSWGYTSAPVGGLSSFLPGNFNLGPASSLGTVVIPTGGVRSNSPSFTFHVTPFTYDPSLGNLLLDISVTDQDLVVNGSGNSYNQVDQTSVTSRAYAFDGNSDGPADTIGLVTGFGTTPEPSSFMLLGASFAVLIAAGRLGKWFGHRAAA
jgi:hypothetical protein